jgi:hypothetical protein
VGLYYCRVKNNKEIEIFVKSVAAISVMVAVAYIVYLIARI